MLAFLLISKAFLAGQIPGAAIGFVVGAFTPSVGRKIKGYFVKESAVLKADAAGVVSKTAASVASASADVVKKV